MSESIDHSWICREDSGIERNRSFKGRKTVTHNSVFAAHRLQCRMTNREIDIRHFVSPSVISSEVEESLIAQISQRTSMPLEI